LQRKILAKATVAGRSNRNFADGNSGVKRPIGKLPRFSCVLLLKELIERKTAELHISFLSHLLSSQGKRRKVHYLFFRIGIQLDISRVAKPVKNTICWIRMPSEGVICRTAAKLTI
jgi:hypothetical protein